MIGLIETPSAKVIVNWRQHDPYHPTIIYRWQYSQGTKTMVGVPQTAPSTKVRAAVPSELIFQLSLDQYHQMIRAGILTEDDPVEPLDGWLVYKMPKNRQHTIATRHARDLIEQHLPPGWYVDAQEPITRSQ